MTPAISTALQRCGCDYQQVKIPLDDLNNHFQDDWTNAALHCISQASSRPNFVTALARIANTLIHNNSHKPSNPSTKPTVHIKLPPVRWASTSNTIAAAVTYGLPVPFPKQEN